MAKRSVTINLVNNTPFYLVHYWEAVCTGSWGPVNGTPPPGPAAQNGSLPALIVPNSTTSFSTADAEFSIFTGTEGWAKYSVMCQAPLAGANLLYIYWNIPYAFSPSSEPESDYIDYAVAASEGTFGNPHANLPNGAPCQQQSAVWPAGSSGSNTPAGLSGPYGVPAGLPIIGSSTVVCEVVVSSMTGPLPTSPDTGNLAASAWNYAAGWPVLLEWALANIESDINWVYTMVLRQSGSVTQSVRQLYDPRKGLRALAEQNKQPSLRKLFSL